MRRLLLAVMVNSEARILFLDEPTNYLDFDAIDVIEEALRAFRGTLIMITHDAYFARNVGFSRRWAVTACGVNE
jgi:ATPase subunit of ABC transporter with duplicated ATPase domains